MAVEREYIFNYILWRLTVRRTLSLENGQDTAGSRKNSIIYYLLKDILLQKLTSLGMR